MAKYPYPDAVYSDELELLCMRVEILQEKTVYSRRLLEHTGEENVGNAPPTTNIHGPVYSDVCPVYSDVIASTVTTNLIQSGQASHRASSSQASTRHADKTYGNFNPLLKHDDGLYLKEISASSVADCQGIDVEEGSIGNNRTGKQFKHIGRQDMNLNGFCELDLQSMGGTENMSRQHMNLNGFCEMDLPNINMGGTVMRKEHMNSLDGGYNSQSSDDDSDIGFSRQSSVYIPGLETSTPRKNSHHENMAELEKLLDDITSWDEINANDTLPYKMNASIGSNEISEPKRESIISSILASSDKDLQNAGTARSPIYVPTVTTNESVPSVTVNDDFVPRVIVNDDPARLSESSDEIERMSEETLTVEKLLAEVREWQEKNDPELFRPKINKFTDSVRDVVTIDIPLDKHGRYDSGSLQTLIRECTESFIKVRVPSDLELNDLNLDDSDDSVFEARTKRSRTLAEYFV